MPGIASSSSSKTPMVRASATAIEPRVSSVVTSGSTIRAPARDDEHRQDPARARGTRSPSPAAGRRTAPTLSAGIRTGPTSGFANTRPVRELTSRTGKERSPLVRRANSMDGRPSGPPAPGAAGSVAGWSRPGTGNASTPRGIPHVAQTSKASPMPNVMERGPPSRGAGTPWRRAGYTERAYHPAAMTRRPATRAAASSARRGRRSPGLGRRMPHGRRARKRRVAGVRHNRRHARVPG